MNDLMLDVLQEWEQTKSDRHRYGVAGRLIRSGDAMARHIVSLREQVIEANSRASEQANAAAAHLERLRKLAIASRSVSANKILRESRKFMNDNIAIQTGRTEKSTVKGDIVDVDVHVEDELTGADAIQESFRSAVEAGVFLTTERAEEILKSHGFEKIRSTFAGTSKWSLNGDWLVTIYYELKSKKVRVWTKGEWGVCVFESQLIAFCRDWRNA